MSALSNKQKRYLADLARRAFNQRGAELRSQNPEFRNHNSAASAPDRQSAMDCLCLAGTAQAESEWRHGHVAAATGKAGLRACTQLDYKTVEAHFLDLLGRPGAAFNAHVQSESEPRRQAESVLLRELGRFGFRLSYAESICRAQFKCAVMDATVGQIWKLVYTVRNRGNARKQETEAVAS